MPAATGKKRQLDFTKELKNIVDNHLKTIENFFFLQNAGKILNYHQLCDR